MPIGAVLIRIDGSRSLLVFEQLGAADALAFEQHRRDAFGSGYLAQRIAVNPAKPLRLAKRLLREGQQQSLGSVLELSAAFQALAHETRDHAEAVDAFLAKREPRFSGE